MSPLAVARPLDTRGVALVEEIETYAVDLGAVDAVIDCYGVFAEAGEGIGKRDAVDRRPEAEHETHVRAETSVDVQ